MPTPFIDIHSHQSGNQPDTFVIKSRFVHEVDEKSEQPFSAGIHPWHLNSRPIEADFSKLEKIAEQKSCIAIGETGLDRAIGTSIDIQKQWFIRHLELSERVTKPVIIHCVRAYSDLIQIRKSGKYKTPWIIHGFNENAKVARDLILLNCWLSVGHRLLHKNSKIAASFPKIHIDRIFLESDDSAHAVSEVYEKASQLFQIPIEDLKQQIQQNFVHLFGKLV